MLERVRIKGFKSLDDVEVRLAPLVVLLGPNASGKSNFLEALLLLSRLGTERTLADAFGGAIRGFPQEAFTLPSGGLPGLLSQQTAGLELEADVRLAGAPKEANRLRYRVAVSLEPRTGVLVVSDERLTRLRRDGHEQSGFAPRIERLDHRLVVRRLGKQGHPQYEEIGLGHTLLSNLQFSGDDRYPDFDRMRRELSGWRIHYLDPRVAMRQAQPPRDVTDIGDHGEQIAPFLYRIKNDDRRSRHFDAVRRALQSIMPLDKLDVDLDPQRGTLDIRLVQGGTPLSSRVISEGTLRLLALCALAGNPWPRNLIAFEEPENGVHPRRIDTVSQILARMVQSSPDRQVMVTTHSPYFAATMARLREDPELEGKILILRTRSEGGFTRIEPLPLAHPLLKSAEVEEALVDPAEERLLRAIYQRGWTDV